MTNQTARTIYLEVFIVLLLIIHFSCSPDNKNVSGNIAVKIIEAKGSVVPINSMEKPKVTMVDERKLKKAPIGNLEVTPIRSNIHMANKTKIASAVKLYICTPGKDSFQLPQKLIITGHTIEAGIPEQVVATDGYIKESNPENFRSFGMQQGLKSLQVNCSMEDGAGNLWFGTVAGVSKYDGKTFTNYTKKEGLGGNDVRCMIEDRSGNIWFGTQDGGLTKYDGKYFTRFAEKDGLSTNVWCALEDKASNLWFGTDDGLFRFNGTDFSHFTGKQGMGNNSNIVTGLTQDRSGNIWIGMESGNVSKYDGSSFSNFTVKGSESDNFVWSVLEDRKGNIWFGTQDEGASKYDGTNITHFTFEDGLCNNSINAITEDRFGNIWFATYDGASSYDGKSFTNFQDKEGLLNNHVNSILEDRSGNRWFNTNDGVSKYSGNIFSFVTDKEGLKADIVTDITGDRNGNTWFCTFEGVSKYDGKSFTFFTDKDQLSDNTATGIVEDEKGNIWFSCFGGAGIKFDGKDFTYFTRKDGIISSILMCIAKDRAGNIWFGSTREGVSKYDGKSFTNYTEKQGLISDRINDIAEDHNGDIWFCTDSGLSKFDGKSFTNFSNKSIFDIGVVSCMSIDRAGNLWFGTNDGVVKYDGKFFTKLTDKVGLVNNVVTGILEDKNRTLWFATKEGLSSISQTKLAELTKKIASNTVNEKDVFFKNYTYEDGFLGIGSGFGAMYEANDGIWISTYDRLTAYHPQSAAFYDSFPPTMQVNGIELFNEKIPWQNLAGKKDTSIVLGNGIAVNDIKFDSTGKWYGMPVNLSLPYNCNYINFNFTGITMHQPGHVKYQYKLEGMDENWSAVTSRTTAPYGNLPHGTYTFKVKSMNSRGVWSQPAAYTFTIRPPWWQTWWAYSIYLLLLAFAAWGLHRYQIKRAIKKEREKNQARELEQAREIEKAYTELKAAQALLIQSEKMASLGELTAGIAHEIQNPLNFVNNFSDINTELIAEMKDEIDKGNIDEVKAIANDIADNEQKINHHGKRADAIVKGMLQHSQKSSGQKAPADINKLADEYLRLSYHGLRAKDKEFNVTMKTEFDETIGNINIIPQDIGRVLLNIYNNAFYAVSKLSNSLKGEQYKPLVSVKTQKINSPSGVGGIEIKVSDNGNGIPQNIINKIFQPFFTTKPTGQGTGLGLSLSYDIIKAHGGEIKVESKEGEGTEFIIQLPV